MLFSFSKLLQAITQPLFWLVLWWVVALLILSFTRRWRRTALAMMWSGKQRCTSGWEYGCMT